MNTMIILKGTIVGAVMLITSGVARCEEKLDKPEWADNKIGYEALNSNYVDVDHGPMTVSGVTAISGFKKITLGKSGLPENISVQDRKVTNGPVRLILENDKGAISYNVNECKLIQTGKSAAEGVAKFDAGEVSVEIKSQFEFDFTVRYSITLTTKSPIALKKVALVFPMNLEGEKLCMYFKEWPDKTYVCLEQQKHRVYKTIKPNDSEVISPGFCAAFWVGNTYYGLGLDFESAKGWNAVKGTELVYEPDTNNMTLNFINKTTNLEKSITYNFFLTPTPLKKMPKDWRAWNYGWRGDVKEKIDRTLINQLIYWSSIWRVGAYNSHWVRNPELLKEVSKKDKGMNLANYVIPSLITSQEVWKTKDDKCYVLEDKYLEMLCKKYSRDLHNYDQSANIPENAIYFKDINERNKVLGPDLMPTKAKNWSVVPAPKLANHLLWGINKFVNEYGVGGIYYDGASCPPNNSDWASWTDPDGIKRSVFHYEWQREFLKRVRYVVKSANPNEIITAHQSGTRSASTLSLCDVIILGETFYYWYNEPEKRDASTNGDFYYAHVFGDIDNLKTEFFYRPWGVPHMFLPEVRGKDGKTFSNLTRGTRTMLAYTLHFDMLYFTTMCDNAEIYKWYRIRNAYGMAGGKNEIVEFIPYWENKMFNSDNSNVKVSYYDKVKEHDPYISYDISKKYLVIVSNLQFGDCEFKLSLPQKLEKAKVREVQSNKEYIPKNGKIEYKLIPYDFAIFEIIGELDEGKGTW